jgi:tetratricopeptide (TPR) repeat protein
MKQVKTSVLLLAAVIAGGLAKAQTIDDGKKFLYYEKYKSAKVVFDKLVTANPANADAAYWLGQTLLAMEDVAGAKSLYQKTLMANNNSPLLIAAMGHIELLEGKNQDARQRFETAISLSQGKNIAILNAVGLANVDAKGGDALYAIDKLKAATMQKGFKDPDVYCNMGDAYRKLSDGGSALRAYENALAIAPNYARASYKIGKIYQTQGRPQEEIYMRYYNDAIAKDAAYAPVYFNLYNYFYETNVTKAAEYLDKYLANTDDDPKNCYYRAAMKFAQGLFQETVSKSDECIAAGGNEPFPNLYGLKGYAYNRLGDSVNAKTSFEMYLQKQKPEKLGPNDFATYAKILLKFPDNDALAASMMDKAIAVDTLENGKAENIRSMAGHYLAQKKFNEAADWYKKLLSIKKNITKTDLYNAGYNYYKAANYTPAIDIFNQYTQKFPDDIFGYYMIGRANAAIDTTMELGLAVPAYEKAAAAGEANPDKTKIKDQLLTSYKYLIAYYFNIKKDKATALSYCDKSLLVDPADAEMIANKEAISKATFAAPKPAPAPKPAKPGTKPAAPAKPKPATTKPATTKPAPKKKG